METVALALGICLPVPALAATGLSVPLPNVVERIAAAQQAERAVIVQTTAELTPPAFTPRTWSSRPVLVPRAGKSAKPSPTRPRGTAPTPAAAPTAQPGPTSVTPAVAQPGVV